MRDSKGRELYGYTALRWGLFAPDEDLAISLCYSEEEAKELAKEIGGEWEARMCDDQGIPLSEKCPHGNRRKNCFWCGYKDIRIPYVQEVPLKKQ